MTKINESFSDIYGRYLRAAKGSSAVLTQEALTDSRSTKSLSTDSYATESLSAELVPTYFLQDIFRPLYGKGQPHVPTIGDHPSFEHLKGGTQKDFCQIVTLFMDLEGSTRLGILYSPEEVFEIKNSFIRSAIEIIKSFNGHVHRIMGDAVMAFFGEPNINPIVSAIDAINCASWLCCFVEHGVRPKLQATFGYNDPFGLRIGIDYGEKDKVLWGSYGHSGIEEVTATSFYVDAAAKLQHSAGRNQIMIGESLQKVIDFPMELLSIKTIQVDDKEQKEEYLQPNIKDRENNPINYKQYILRWEDYLLYSPMAQGQNFYKNLDAFPLPISIEICDEQNNNCPGTPVIPCGSVLPKNKHLRFKVGLRQPLVPPYTIKTFVENHGKEAFQRVGETCGNHSCQYPIDTKNKQSNFVHWETTAYKGLHYFTMEIHAYRGIVYKTRAGIYIE